MNPPGLQVNSYYYLRSTNKGTGEGHHMLRSTCGDQGEAQLGSACPLPAGLQAGPQEAQRVGAIGYNRPALRTRPQGWLRPLRGPDRWFKQVMGPQGHLEPRGWFPDLTGMEQP